MKAILTRYLPFTNHKPARIKASAEGVPSVTFATELLHSQSDSNHVAAAKYYALRNNWSGALASGQLPNGDFVHCFIPDQYL